MAPNSYAEGMPEDAEMLLAKVFDAEPSNNERVSLPGSSKATRRA